MQEDCVVSNCWHANIDLPFAPSHAAWQALSHRKPQTDQQLYSGQNSRLPFPVTRGGQAAYPCFGLCATWPCGKLGTCPQSRFAACPPRVPI